jgi:hypothetical protein
LLYGEALYLDDVDTASDIILEATFTRIAFVKGPFERKEPKATSKSKALTLGLAYVRLVTWMRDRYSRLEDQL